jgi:hypothetical protein
MWTSSQNANWCWPPVSCSFPQRKPRGSNVAGVAMCPTQHISPVLDKFAQPETQHDMAKGTTGMAYSDMEHTCLPNTDRNLLATSRTSGFWFLKDSPPCSEDLWSPNGSCALDTLLQPKDYEGDNVPSFNVEVKNAWIFTSTPTAIRVVFFFPRDGGELNCERGTSTKYYRYSLLIAILTPVPHKQTAGAMYVFHIITKTTKANYIKKGNVHMYVTNYCRWLAYTHHRFRQAYRLDPLRFIVLCSVLPAECRDSN